MSAARITDLEDRFAKAKTQRRDVGVHYERLRSAVRDEIAHELCMRAAREERARQERTLRDLRTLRETLGFGVEERR